ncbi:MAG: hypothetical protein Q7S29_03375 [Candidatus Peribacter sp.]|nr:hypothetical protein [Candidatus Peribacter sp.]
MKKLLLILPVLILVACAPSKDAVNDDPRITAVQTMLIGRWSSEEDRNFEREYREDGSVVDFYASAEGETETAAAWSLFTSDNAPSGVKFQMNNQNVYIAQTEKDGTVTYFRITGVTSAELEIVNMTGNGGMRFGRLATGVEMRDGIED